MDEALVQLVWQRAHRCCEYCQLPQVYSTVSFEVDHVIAGKHGGPTSAGNLALTCFYCDSFKGPNIAGIDPRTRKIVRLYTPRRHKWDRHFRWEGPLLVGRTPVGRATIDVLNISDPVAVATRAVLLDAGLFPAV